MPSSVDLASRLAGVVAAQQELLAVVDDRHRIMQKLVERAPEITGGVGAVIEMVDGNDLVYTAASGPAQEHIGLRLPLDKSLSGEAVRTNDLVRCDDSELDLRVDAAACRRIGIRSMIIVPIVQGSTAIGALKTFSPHASAFDDLDAYALQLLAGAASSALMQARSALQRKLSEEHYRMLFERNVAGVFRTTAGGRILDCNESLVRSLGYDSREELMQRETWDLYSERADREKLLERLQRDQSITNARIRLKKRDGTPFPSLMTVTMIHTLEDGDQLLGILVEDR